MAAPATGYADHAFRQPHRGGDKPIEPDMMAACATVRIVGETAPSPPPRSGASPSLLPPHVCGPPPSARYKSSHACHTRRATPDVRFLRLRAHAPGVLFVWVRGGDAQGAAGQRAAGQAWRARTGWTVCQRRADAAFPAVPITGRREPDCRSSVSLAEREYGPSNQDQPA